MKDYYKILQLEFGSDILAVKKAYRKLALYYHPDLNKASDSAQNFIEITEAYEVLRDKGKKRKYDSLYEAYINAKQQESPLKTSNEWNCNQRQREWAYHGRKKAEEYSSIPFDEFRKRLIKELALSTRYLPNVIAIVFAGSAAITTLKTIPSVFEYDVVLGLLLSVIFAGLVYLVNRLLLVTKADYIVDRNQKN